MYEIVNTTRQYINLKRYTKTIRAEAAAVKAQVTQALWFLAKWFYNLVAREARAVREPRVGPSELQTRSSHLYLYISDGVRHDVIQ